MAAAQDGSGMRAAGREATMNLFSEMALSVHDFGGYGRFLTHKKSHIFSFGLLVMLIYFGVVWLFPSLFSMGIFFGSSKGFWEQVPDFELKDGRLWVDDTVEMEQGGVYLRIDTENDFYFQDMNELEDLLSDYSSVVILDSEKFILKSGDEIMGSYYTDLNLELDRSDLAKFVPLLYLLYGLSMLFLYVWITALFFFGVLVLALVGMAMASWLHCELTFGQIYILGVYSRTLPLLIKAVVSFLPVQIPFFWVINFGLSLFIMGSAMQKIGGQRSQDIYR